MASERARSAPGQDPTRGGIASDATLGSRGAAELWDHWADKPRIDERFGDDFAQAALGILEDRTRPRRDAKSAALDSAASTAALLSVDRFHGLLEIIQNAEDVGADVVRFGLRRTGDGEELLAAHNGGRVTLRDVVGMTLAFLSTKADDPEKKGRFGIGLKTLERLGSHLEVHSAPYHFSVVRNRLRVVPPVESIRHFYSRSGPAPDTLLRLRLHGDVDVDEIRKLFAEWDASALLFLDSVRRIAFRDFVVGGTDVEHRLEVETDDAIPLRVGDETLTAARVVLRDGHANRWTRYTVRLPVPASRKRQRTLKKAGDWTPLAIAVPHATRRGRLYTALPLQESSRPPYSVDAQFTPDASRSKIHRGDPWNTWLVGRLGEFVAAVALDRLEQDPSRGWLAVALRRDFPGSKDDQIVEALRQSLVQKAQRRLAQRLRFEIHGARVALRDVLFEEERLDGILSVADIEAIGSGTALPGSHRDGWGRWRRVLSELGRSKTVGTEDALDLLYRDELVATRPAKWFVALAGAALDAGLDDRLLFAPVVRLSSGERVMPPTGGDPPLVSRSTGRGLLRTLSRERTIARAYLAKREPAVRVRLWLEGIGALRPSLSRAELVRALAVRDAEEPLEVSRSEVVVLRNAVHALGRDDREELGSEVGRRILVEGFEYTSGRRTATRVRPGDAYLPASIADREDGWAAAAGKTEGLRWVAPAYEKTLRAGKSKKITAKTFFDLLGSADAPRLEPSPTVVHGFGRGSPLVGRKQPRAQLERLPDEATHLQDDHVSPDLDAVLKDLRRRMPVRERRRRANALVATLNRAWDDSYRGHEVATAASFYRSWIDHGTVPATWLGQLASSKWLPSEAGKPSAPMDLAIRTPATELLYGQNPERFAEGVSPGQADAPIWRWVGIKRDPPAREIVKVLRRMRDRPARREDVAAGSLAAYVALASLCPRGEVTGDEMVNDMTITNLRSAFGRSPGLVYSSDAWHQPKNVFLGREIFRGRRAFLPKNSQAAALWHVLGIEEPHAGDCLRVLSEIARDKPHGEHDGGMLTAIYRRIEETVETTSAETRRALLRTPLWIGTRWRDKRPVFAVADQEVAEQLAAAGLPVWLPPVPVTALRLSDAFGVTPVDESAFSIESTAGIRKPESLSLTRDVPAVLDHLQAILQEQDERLRAGCNWRRFGRLQVSVNPQLELTVSLDGHRPVKVSPGAFMQLQPLILHVRNADALVDWRFGGKAIAPLFRDGDKQRLALAWCTAWQNARARLDAEVLSFPEVPAEDPVSPQVEGLAEFGPRRKTVERDRRGPAPAATGTKATPPGTRPLSELKDPTAFEVVSKGGGGTGRRGRRARAAGDRMPVDPPPGAGTRRRYSRRRAAAKPVDLKSREEVALDFLAMAVRDEFGEELEDVHLIPDVGADARDSAGRYYEMKMTAGELKDDVTLRASQFRRADLMKDKFILAVVAGISASTPGVSVLFFPSPLETLEPSQSEEVTLSGVAEGREARRLDFGRR